MDSKGGSIDSWDPRTLGTGCEIPKFLPSPEKSVVKFAISYEILVRGDGSRSKLGVQFWPGPLAGSPENNPAKFQLFCTTTLASSTVCSLKSAKVGCQRKSGKMPRISARSWLTLESQSPNLNQGLSGPLWVLHWTPGTLEHCPLASGTWNCPPLKRK